MQMSARILAALCGFALACSSSRARVSDTDPKSDASPRTAIAIPVLHGPDSDSSRSTRRQHGPVQADTSVEARSRFDLRAGDLSSDRVTRLRLEILEVEVAQYYRRHATVPGQLSEILKMPASAPTREPDAHWLVDGWGHPFLYSRAALPDSFEIRSAGPDGRFGTHDDIARGERARNHAP